MHSSNKDMSVITQCPLSFRGLNSLLLCTTETNSASFCLHIHDKNRLCYKRLGLCKSKYGLQQDAVSASEAQFTITAFKADQLHPWRAMLEICLTCRATPISARLSFRVYFHGLPGRPQPVGNSVPGDTYSITEFPLPWSKPTQVLIPRLKKKNPTRLSDRTVCSR